MAETIKIRFLLFVSLMIFPARALDVILSGAHQHFKQKSEIKFDVMDGEKIYRGTLNHLTYQAQNGTSKVVVYIISRSRCVEILRTAVSETRSQIARKLREMHYDLVFLGIEHIDDDEYHLIGAFILEKIQPHPDRPDIIIETIGENRFDRFYGCHVLDFEKYQENAHICGGTLLARLRSIPRGALRPIGSNNKEIRLYGYYPITKEVWLPVCVENNTYVPGVNVSDPKYNFKIKNPRKRICLLIVSGKEYSAIISFGNRGAQRTAMAELLSGMTKQKEALVILGVFNFEWTEIDIVTQIILKHSEASRSTDYNVFTCGYGMFNTIYRNVNYQYDRRYIWQQPNSYVSEVIKVLMGKEVKKRAMNVYYYYEDSWKVLDTTIDLSNGRYIPEVRYINFTLPCRYRKVAFIVYDRMEMNNPVDYPAVSQSLVELERSEISVVLIEAFHFGLNDVHIIAEWIDQHNRFFNFEQIAVLGGGVFETIFQSESTTYNTFLNTNKNELEAIRNAHVNNGNGKSVSVANMDYDDFEVWSFPMNTIVNGCYELDLIPDKNLFNNTGEKKIFFIITSAYTFKQISAIKKLGHFSTWFGYYINQQYPYWRWSIYLVGLDNFGEKDCHLFAELVRRQTDDERLLQQFVRTVNYGMRQDIYQYKDSAPLDADNCHSYMHERFTYFIGQHVTLVSTDTNTDD